jgi:hypothetical protein
MIHISVTSSEVDILTILCMALPLVRNMNSYFINSWHTKNIQTNVAEFNEVHVLVIPIKNLLMFQQYFLKP